MKSLCAWCYPSAKIGGDVTHGICAKHAQEIRDDIDAEVKRESNRNAIVGIIAELCEAHDVKNK